MNKTEIYEIVKMWESEVKDDQIVLESAKRNLEYWQHQLNINFPLAAQPKEESTRGDTNGRVHATTSAQPTEEVDLSNPQVVRAIIADATKVTRAEQAKRRKRRDVLPQT